MSRLIVLVPALGTNCSGWTTLVDRLSTEPSLRDSVWLPFEHGKRWFSLDRVRRLALDLQARIHQEWVARGPYDDIVLAGHGFGGLLVRQSFLGAVGADHRAEHPPYEWASKISRIILFAAPNRGINLGGSWIAKLGAGLIRRSPLRYSILWQLVRGSSFITNLRIQWTRYLAAAGTQAPVVIQVMGTHDRLVTREDSADIEQFPTGYYSLIAQANHANLLRLADIPDPSGRYAILRDAFVHDRPVHAENITISGPDTVVFVLHGIRDDNRQWVADLTSVIRSQWPTAHVIGPDYGFISAAQFTLPWTRRRKLPWFQDAYSQALARNPSAKFSFIGHSNGTYLFGQSLKEIPGMRFERAVLVGSVLPATYPWDERIRLGQLRQLRVDGSCYDWPVGWLCSALHGVGMLDIGTGGFDGFREMIDGQKHEFLWYRGGHGAPLSAENLPALASFALDGQVIPPQRLAGRVTWFSVCSRILRRVAPLWAILGVLSFMFFGYTNRASASMLLIALALVILIADVI